jgi:hypothetical protein
MSVHSTIATTPLWRRQQFWRVALPVLAVIAAIVAGVAVYDSVYGSNGTPIQKNWGVTYRATTKPKTVKLDPAVRQVAHTFIWTAVARRNLATAYALSGPEMRQGMSLKQFLTGNIPATPYPIRANTKVRYTVDYSYANSARLEAFVVTPGLKVHSPHTFFIDLVKRRGTWFVNTWVPRWTPPIPTQPGR